MKKTRKALSILLSILLALSFCSVAFAEGDECAHENMEAHNAAPALCGQNGHRAYFFCPDCVQYFTDFEGLEPVAYDSLRVAPEFAEHDFVAAVGFEEVENGIWLSVSPEADAEYIDIYGKSFFDLLAENSITLEAKYCSHCGVVVIVDDGEEISEVTPYEIGLDVNGEYVAPDTPDNPDNPGDPPADNHPAEENKEDGNKAGDDSKGAFIEFLERFFELLKNLISFFMQL